MYLELQTNLRRAAYGQPTSSPAKSLLNQAADALRDNSQQIHHLQYRISKLRVQRDQARGRFRCSKHGYSAPDHCGFAVCPQCEISCTAKVNTKGEGHGTGN